MPPDYIYLQCKERLNVLNQNINFMINGCLLPMIIRLCILMKQSVRTAPCVVELVKQRRPFLIIIPWNAREMYLFVFIAANVPMHVPSVL